MHLHPLPTSHGSLPIVDEWLNNNNKNNNDNDNINNNFIKCQGKLIAFVERSS